ncbi:MAG: hypothetical protein K6F53_12485 [Lachnospiraceae bacterium]|nr:hypothetical protein [Lachnospiraceae bacterium]
MRKRRRNNRITALSVALSLLLCAVLSGPGIQTFAAENAGKKLLTMKAARALALEESSAYFQALQDIAGKKAAVASAKKAVKMQKKDWATFRWSPLLKFKFPTTPSQQELYELEMKPVTAQAELDDAQNALIEVRLGIYAEINNLYVDIVTKQRTIEFNKQRSQTLSTGIAKNKALLLTGDASQEDVDALVKKKESIEEKIAADTRGLDADLRKMSNKIGTDISTRYRFETPFVEANIDRTKLPSLIQYTLDWNHTYYQACMEDTTARAQLETNYSMLRKKYGGDINMISGYVTQVLGGQELKGSQAAAFKKDYDAFIVKIDSYWEGKRKILFIKVPRLWFKGSKDGTRYIQDDPEQLYQNVLDYSSAHAGKKDAEISVTEEVIDAYENYISVRNSYQKSIREIDKARKDLEADLLRNKLGRLSFEEYQSEEEDFEELQNDFLSTMQTYAQTLYSFDKTTMGAVGMYLTGGDQALSTAESGISSVEKEFANGAQYYLKQIIQQEAFELYVYIPDDFPIEVTHFELWCDGEQIGERTEVGKRLRHLALATESVNEVKIRVLNDGVFVDDVVIDQQEQSGPLPIVSNRRIVKTDANELGLYEISRNEVTGIVSVKLKITEDESIASYKVKTESGVFLSEDKPIPVDKTFNHLGLMEDGLNDLTLVFLDGSGGELYEGRFDTVNHKVLKKKAD